MGQPVSGLKIFSKIAEKLLGGFLISDMSQMRNPSQYGDHKGMSVNHCFIKMIHEILVSLDTNSATEKFFQSSAETLTPT